MKPHPDHNPPGRAMDFNVPIVPFRSARGYGKTQRQEEMLAAWANGRVDLLPQTDLTPIYEQLRRTVEDASAALTKAYDSLRSAGLVPEEPPTDPRARALWAHQNRNTGPARPSAAQARRPRRHK